MSKLQDLQEARLRATFYNELDGNLVADVLNENRELWKGYVITRLGSLIELRDIDDDFLNVDTLYIVPSPGREDELVEVSTKWRASEIDWVEQKEASELLGGTQQKLLRLWWD